MSARAVIETLFRGTPEPERNPRPRDFGAVFLSKKREQAQQYGQHVASYETGLLQLLDTSSPEACAAVEEFRGEPFSSDLEWADAWPSFFMFPEADFMAFLNSKGWDGFATDDDVAIGDPSVLRSGAVDALQKP
jgi:hypothetical protein